MDLFCPRSSSSTKGVCCIYSLLCLGDSLPWSKHLGADTEEWMICCKICERKRQTRCLPQDLLFKILLHLPALLLHDVMRHVCREWNLMVSDPIFIRHHLRNSRRGILIQERYLPHNASYVELRRGSLEICKFNYRFENLVWTSCNGFVLNPNCGNLSVTNPLTNQRILVPPFSDQTRHYAYFYLAFAEASLEYKVVHAIIDDTLGGRLWTQIAVLTIGVDKVWRHIDTEYLPLSAMEDLTKPPLVTGAYIQWTRSSFVLTLNVETETICRFPLPVSGKRWIFFLPMGNYLSIICESSKFLWDVWEMNPETGQSTMLLSFELKPLIYRFKELIPVFSESIIPLGWLADREVLLFSTSYIQVHYVAYNVITREMQSFELTDRLHLFQAHMNSMVRLE